MEINDAIDNVKALEESLSKAKTDLPIFVRSFLSTPDVFQYESAKCALEHLWTTQQLLTEARMRLDEIKSR